ncbi:MAG: spore coat protein U domain-containing protein [Candidatus Dasytiphilus stammeri]
MSIKNLVFNNIIIKIHWFSIITLVIIQLFFFNVVLAHCWLSDGKVELSNSTSFAVLNGSIKAEGNSGLACSGLSMTLLTHNKIKGKIIGTYNNMQLKNLDGSGDTISYMIYPDKNYQYAYKSGDSIDYKSLNLISMILSSTNSRVPLYIKTSPNANVRAGVYQDIIQMNWEYSICRFGSLVCFSSWNGKGSTFITVKIIINKDCIINNIPDINFGSHALIHQFKSSTINMTVSCTKQENYKLWFTEGNHFQDQWRRLSDNNNHYIQYNLYHPENNLIWNKNNTKQFIGTGFPQLIAYKAIINPTQIDVPSGNYTDTVSVIIEY